MKRLCLVSAVALLGMGCAHKSLDAAALDTIQRPAFVGRILKDAGPKATVFTDDPSFREGLKRLEPAEGNRRLANWVRQGLPQQELSDGLRSRTLLRLEHSAPFRNAANPSRVARALGIFLTQDETSLKPNYQALEELNVDSVVEVVIEEYGVRSADGKLRFWVKGNGRMFRLKGESVLWKRSFYAEEEASTLPVTDPFVMAKDPSMFRNRLHWILDTVAQKFAEDLLPGQRPMVAPRQETSPVVLPPASWRPADDEDPL
jgi:hypothetical protein